MMSQEVFVTKVKPLIENFLKSPTSKTVNELSEGIRVLETTHFSSIQNYMLIPLLIHMDKLSEKPGTSEIRSSLLDIFQYVLPNIFLRQIQALKTLLIIILKQIFDFNKGHIRDNVEESLKMSAVRCMTIALKRTTSDIVEQFYIKKNISLIGQIALCCVELIQKEKYKLLRIEALSCLVTIFYVHDETDFNDVVLRSQVAGLVFVYIPKIVKTLIDVIKGDEKQGEKVIAKAILALNRILCLIFEDYDKRDIKTFFEKNDFIELLKNDKTESHMPTDDEVLGNNIKQKTMDERLRKLKSLDRNDSWLAASSRKLKPVLNLLQHLRSNKSPIVRREYLSMCCNLLLKCARHLRDSVTSFLETVVSLSTDEDIYVRQKCEEFIRILDAKQILPFFMDEVESLFNNLMIRLPRIINRKDGVEQQSELLFLKGLLSQLSDKNLYVMLSGANNLNMLCMTLISLLELEVSSNLIEEDHAFKIFDRAYIERNPTPWRKYKNIQNSTVLNTVENVCKVLGASKAFELVFDRFMEIYQTNVLLRNEIILILILTLPNCSKEHKLGFVNIIFEELLKEEHWHLLLTEINTMATENKKNDNSAWYVDRTPGLYESAIEIRVRDIDLENDDHAENGDMVTLNDVKFNVLHTCITLDGIATFSVVLKHDVQPLMIKTLHRVLEKGGSENKMIRTAAFHCLCSIQKALNYEEIHNLLCDFSDYIIFNIYSSLKKIHESDTALHTLISLIHYTNLSSISYLENVIASLVEKTSELEYSKHINLFLHVFYIFLCEIDNLAPQIKQKESSVHSPSGINYYDNWKKILQNNVENVDDNSMKDNDMDMISEQLKDKTVWESDNEETETIKLQLPKHLEIVLKIMKGVVKFVSSSDKALKAKSLDCICVGVPLLKKHEDELLPLVHLIWYPFIERFKDQDSVILYRCFTLLEILAVCAKDFLLQRSLKDVVPYLNDFLRKMGKRSETETGTSETMELKLQKKLLLKYPTIISNIEINGKELDGILEAALPYLSMTQPHSLQKYSVEFFKTLSVYNGPCIYVKLLSKVNDATFSHNSKHIIKFITK